MLSFAAAKDGFRARAPLAPEADMYASPDFPARGRTAFAALLLSFAACEDGTGPVTEHRLTQVVLSDSVLVVPSGSAGHLGFRLLCQHGLTIQRLPAGMVLRWTSADTGIATVAAGLVTGRRSGQTMISAEAGRVTVAARVVVQLGHLQLQLLRGDLQKGAKGQTLEQPLEVRVLDPYGVPLQNAEVEFFSIQGGGTFALPVQKTDTQGIARASWSLGPVPGLQRAAASVKGQKIVPIVFSATALRQIAFASTRGSHPLFPESEIYLMNEDGSDQRQLTFRPHPRGLAFNVEPMWAPDGSRIAFASFRDGNREIYVMDGDGGHLTRLTRSPGGEWQHTWSPNGTRILFVSERDGNKEIYVMEADGSGQRRLTNHDYRDEYPSWSPDGTRIVFARGSAHDDTTWIMVMNADGTSPTALRQGTAGVRVDRPGWSPSGSTISFTRTSYSPPLKSEARELAAMNPDGTDERTLVPLREGDLTTNMVELFAWSPDGRRIAVVMSAWYGIGPATSLLVCVMNANGQGRQCIDECERGHTGNFAPSWSADGKKLAYVNSADSNPDVCVTDVHGALQGTRVTSAPGADTEPAWRP